MFAAHGITKSLMGLRNLVFMSIHYEQQYMVTYKG